MDIILACRTIQPELEHTMKAESCPFPVLWVDAEYHDFPEKLREVLQNTLDSISNVDHVLLVFGFCGNALVGITPHGFQLVIPKADDCITLLLGSSKRRKELELHSYFFTAGWLGNHKSILTEYADTAAQYGEESADYVYNFMLEGYKNALLIDSKTGDINAVGEKIRSFTDKFHLEQSVVDGDMRLFRKLITQDWDEDFIVIQPEETITQNHLFGE